MNKPLDEKAFDADVLGNIPTPDSAPQPLPEAPQAGATQAQNQAPFSAETALRHGRIAGRSLGVSYRRATGKELDKDVGDTIGELMGEAFTALGNLGFNFLRIIVLLLCVLPVVFTTVAEIRKAMQGEKEA